MDKKDKKKSQGFIIEEHGDPKKMSRRQLLAQGFIKGSGVVMAPSVISTLATKQAFGSTCGGENPQSSSNVPVMIMDLAGGGNLVGANIIAGTQAGQGNSVGGLATIGIDGPAVPVNEFGLAWHQESMILRGMRNAIPEEARAKVKGVVFAAKSIDDNNTNPVNPAHALLKAGLNGDLTELIAANSNSAGTPRSKLPPGTEVSGITPVVMNSSDDAKALVKKHELAQQLTPAALDKILKAAAGMSESALCDFNKKSLSEQLKAVCGCKHDKSMDIMTKFSENNVTPAQDAEIQRIFNGAGGADGSTATYAKMLANGFAGVGVRLQGGFDYHNGTRSLGDAKDLILGDEIGRMIAYADAINKPISVVILTDGATLSTGKKEGGGYNGALQAKLTELGRGDLNPLIASEGYGTKLDWITDANGVRGAVIMFVYHPEGVKHIKDPQVGSYKDAGVVNDDNPIGGSLPNTVAALTANWLALTGRQGEIGGIVPSDLDKKIDDFIVFDKIGK